MTALKALLIAAMLALVSAPLTAHAQVRVVSTLTPTTLQYIISAPQLPTLNAGETRTVYLWLGQFIPEEASVEVQPPQMGAVHLVGYRVSGRYLGVDLYNTATFMVTPAQATWRFHILQ